MCRWLAYSGAPILLETALYSPANSLIDQSLHAKLGAEATNGDGFGVGWYDLHEVPGVFRSIEPAWNDQNLRELSGHVSSAAGRVVAAGEMHVPTATQVWDRWSVHPGAATPRLYGSRALARPLGLGHR
jgi:predicted glutamine amidotransferase